MTSAFIFTEIDEAINRSDLKRAEVAIARRLRGTKNAAERAALLFRRAQVRLQDARPDDALEDLHTALALHHKFEGAPDTHILFGDIYFARYELSSVGFTDRADSEAALQHYQLVIEAAPDHPLIAWVYYQVGRVRLSQDAVTGAEDYFQRALQAPNNPPNIHALSYERLGFIHLIEKREPRAALDCFRQAIQHHPTDYDTGWLAQLYLRISRAHLDLGEHKAGLEAAQKALREIQQSSNGTTRTIMPEAQMAVGDVLALIPGEEAEAIKHYLRFLQSSKRPPGIDVTWSKVHETLGQLYFRLERYPEAISAYEKALEFNPYHPWEVNLHYQIARCFYRLRAYERAVDALQQMQRSAHNDQTKVGDWRVFNLLGNAYFALENYHAAIDAYRQAIELAPPSANGIEKAEIYLRFSEELLQTPE